MRWSSPKSIWPAVFLLVSAWQGEVRMRTKSGEPILTRVRASATHEAGGKRLGLATVVVDIGDIKRRALPGHRCPRASGGSAMHPGHVGS